MFRKGSKTALGISSSIAHKFSSYCPCTHCWELPFALRIGTFACQIPQQFFTSPKARFREYPIALRSVTSTPDYTEKCKISRQSPLLCPNSLLIPVIQKTASTIMLGCNGTNVYGVMVTCGGQSNF